VAPVTAIPDERRGGPAGLYHFAGALLSPSPDLSHYVQAAARDWNENRSDVEEMRDPNITEPLKSVILTRFIVGRRACFEGFIIEGRPEGE
jgi:hypothetical protein